MPADLRLFETKNFHVDESALTGESVPVEKGCVAVAIDALLGDRRCMAYSGTLVTSGQARGVVVATAGDTELGRIGTLLREVRTLATPLLRQIASFSRWLAWRSCCWPAPLSSSAPSGRASRWWTCSCWWWR